MINKFHIELGSYRSEEEKQMIYEYELAKYKHYAVCTGKIGLYRYLTGVDPFEIKIRNKKLLLIR